MEKQEKKSKKEIWKEISLDFKELSRELWLWWFSKKLGAGRTSENEEKQLLEQVKIQKKKVGMFFYAEEKSFSEELIPNKKVSGVVYYVNETGEHGLVVLLHQKKLQWLNDCPGIDVDVVSKGKKATRLILEFARNRGLKAKAAEYCANYMRDGVNAGEAFLPSIDELKRLYENKRFVDEKLAMIKGADLLEDWHYWSSFGVLYDRTVSLCFSNGSVYRCHVYYHLGYARPVVDF